jgi:hypothetical protein
VTEARAVSAARVVPEDARAFAAETMGARRAEFKAHHARADTTRETWALQETPMGSFMLVWFEGDVEKAFADLATNDSDFITWFRDRMLDLTGVDFGAPSDAPPVFEGAVQLCAWRSAEPRC